MSVERDRRRAMARAAGARANGIGPAVATQCMAGGVAATCGGVLVMGSVSAFFGVADFGPGERALAVAQVTYASLGAAQVWLALRLHRAEEAVRTGKADDKSLLKATNATLAASALHVVLPFAIALWFAAERWLNPVPWGPQGIELVLECFTPAIPAELLPVPALLYTLRAWRRVMATAHPGGEGEIKPLDPDELRTGRLARILRQAGTLQLVAAITSLSCGVLFGLGWGTAAFAGQVSEPGEVVAICMLLGIHGLIAAWQAGTGVMFVVHGREPANVPDRRWSTARSVAVAHFATTLALTAGIAVVSGWPWRPAITAPLFSGALPAIAWWTLSRARRDWTAANPLS